VADPPTNIRAHQAEQILELTWAGEEPVRLSYHLLRSECPCASCRDEWTGKRILDASTIRTDLRLDAMEPIGNYAVRLGWNDGHGSGLYSWDLFRQLAADTRHLA
jgi:DUF971 family protein